MEEHLDETVRGRLEALSRTTPYNPSYVLRLLDRYGPAEACRRLVRTRGMTSGFARLWEHRYLTMSVEALVILPWYEELFDDDLRKAARQRLETYGFDVEEYLAALTACPPGWWSARCY